MPITHAFTNPKADGADTTVVRPSDWNAGHVLTGTYVTADCSADVTLSADTPADAPSASVSLVAGTWVLIGQLTLTATSGSNYGLIYITDGSNVVVGEGRGLNTSATPTTLAAFAVVSPVSTTTYKLRGQAGVAGTLKIVQFAEGSNIGTRIVAMRML